nr:hypothetical protein [Bradyrhizobium diazoefficiens]
MRRIGGVAGGVNCIGGLGSRCHGVGQSIGVRFGGEGFLRLGDGLGRNHGLGADRRDRSGRLVGMIVVVVMTMVVMIVSVLVIMGVMIVVLMIVMSVIPVIMVMMIVPVMIVIFVLAVMLRVGVQVLALVRNALGVLREGLAFDRLGRRIGADVETLDDVAADALAMTATTGVAVARAAPTVGAVLALFLGFAMGLLLSLDQRLPVGDRDLVVVGMDFAEGEEAVAVAAIFNESGLERGFDPCDLGEVDIPAQLLALCGLEVKLFDAIAADHDDPGLFRVGGIDQHLVGHVLTLGGGGRDRPWARRALPGDATVHLIRG